MKIFGIAGWSGCGKTTLVTRLIPLLTARGVRVGTLKHSHHDIRLGNSEQAALLAAGAAQSLAAGPERFALVTEHHGHPEPSLAELVGAFAGIDLLLVEGFKFSNHPKLEVWDPGLGKPLLAAGDASILAVACDQSLDHFSGPVFRRDAVDAICQWVLDFCGMKMDRGITE
ncbi:Molybdopterin-guanine dinucleotide biosynthesis protein [Magnetospirillum sp. LM-5]|uniref:molybdopterin-guanine dinucleotide biosynthesis protein B n=1 Tax=Magnetospirillum sp. LM-5 TaxID=2681466 RepID=UPI0013861DCF|nr:molybdopterin-guanine dinucleotide biosynthesis protein B [Magnetospirillum sp. LM-5]CAA7612895.1 Molybdopterin-guanine dinucleotide biosynthesis protein [Magnetospirillum sp. LM-5]